MYKIVQEYNLLRIVKIIIMRKIEVKLFYVWLVYLLLYLREVGEKVAEHVEYISAFLSLFFTLIPTTSLYLEVRRMPATFFALAFFILFTGQKQ